jgi:hypothetical protein
MAPADTYSVQEQAREVFLNGILNNPLVCKDLPPDVKKCSSSIRFEGAAKPSLPVNWRFAESISALKAFEATLLNVLLLRKYNVEPPRVVINT